MLQGETCPLYACRCWRAPWRNIRARVWDRVARAVVPVLMTSLGPNTSTAAQNKINALLLAIAHLAAHVGVALQFGDTNRPMLVSEVGDIISVQWIGLGDQALISTPNKAASIASISSCTFTGLVR